MLGRRWISNETVNAVPVARKKKKKRGGKYGGAVTVAVVEQASADLYYNRWWGGHKLLSSRTEDVQQSTVQYNTVSHLTVQYGAAGCSGNSDQAIKWDWGPEDL